MLRAARILVFVLAGSTAAIAQSAPEDPVISEGLQALFDAVEIQENFTILAEVGLQDAIGLEDTLFPGRGGAAWRSILGGLYEPDALRSAFMSGFPTDRMSVDEMERVTTFYSTELGQRIVEGELVAWREISRAEVEATANDVYFQHLEDNNPRIALLGRFNDVNGFVDLNVSGALNSNFAFYRGMSDTGAYEQAVPQSMMLNEVWGQEPEIRRDTVLWLYSFQLMAYAGLSDTEIETYIAFSETEAGQAFNTALFAGFDAVFEVMSYRLGSAAALFMSGENL